VNFIHDTNEAEKRGEHNYSLEINENADLVRVHGCLSGRKCGTGELARNTWMINNVSVARDLSIFAICNALRIEMAYAQFANFWRKPEFVRLKSIRLWQVCHWLKLILININAFVLVCMTFTQSSGLSADNLSLYWHLTTDQSDSKKFYCFFWYAW